jgi:hypothetical protein
MNESEWPDLPDFLNRRKNPLPPVAEKAPRKESTTPPVKNETKKYRKKGVAKKRKTR